MTIPARSKTGLRRPLAIASVIALTSGLTLGFAPAAGATHVAGHSTAGGTGSAGGNGTTGGNGGAGGWSGGPGGRPKSQPVSVAGLPGTISNLSQGANGGTGSINCVDDNLGRLARGVGGSVHAVEIDDHCLVIHRFNTSEAFEIFTRPGFPMQILVVGAGGGAGGGSGWEDSTKAPGAEPESGAGAGGAGGDVYSADVSVNAATGAFTYTPRDPENIDGSFVYTPTAIPAGTSVSDPAGRTLTTEITVGLGGSGGTAGTSVAGSTAGGQGGAGGESAFGDFRAGGGGGGFGGGATEGSEPGVQAAASRRELDGGRAGGSNATHVGFNLGPSPTIDHAAPGGAGATEDGHEPTPVGTTGNGGNGGAGALVKNYFINPTPFGAGGGGGTISPASPPFAAVTGGTGGPEGFGGRGAAGGNGEDALDGFGGGGGGAGGDGSVTVGDSNAGVGGKGGNGVVFVRYLALAAPATPAAPDVEAVDSSAILTITPLADTPDQYVVWAVGEPDLQCTVTPPETSCAIEGLTNGEDYTFETFAWNHAGESDSSADSLTITPSADAGALPYTGNNSRGLTSLALIMIGLGGAVTAFARRRRTITIN